MNFSEITSNKVDGTTYSSITVEFGKQKWSFMLASGKHNYLNVNRVSQNPFRGPGKDFTTVFLAMAAYKNQKMKTLIMDAYTKLETSQR